MGYRRIEEMREKRGNVKYAGFPLKQHVPQSLIISWRKDLDRGITRGINTADFPLSPVLHYVKHPKIVSSASFARTRIAVIVIQCQQVDHL